MADDSDNPSFKERFIGSVSPRTHSGGHLVDQEGICAPFSEVDAVVRSFCTGCGSVMEHSFDTALELAVQSGLVPAASQSYSGRYFECATCICCGKGFEGLVLK